MKLGSLFDGSGGFPLAGIQAGIEPVWASEIEPFPIRVTTKRIPQMKHYGNITDMNGAETEPVDIITFGSPCQDLSLAGKRAGIKDGERSNLFFEAIRIIKEMRQATNGVYPKYIVWENVCGAFSSNRGEDFRAVLESICQIADETASVPKPDKWTPAGSIVGDGYSVAWRVLDAQYWGVPQRRRRIFLVAGFGDEHVADIVFEKVSPESQGLCRDPEASGTQGQTTAGDTQDGTGAADYTVRIRCGKPGGGKGALIQQNKSGTLGTNNDQTLFQKICLNDQGGSYMTVTENVTGTLRAQMGGHPPLVVDQGGGKSACNVYEDKSPTLTTTHQGEPAVCYGFSRERCGAVVSDKVSPTILAAAGESRNNKPMVCYGVDSYNLTTTGDKARCLAVKPDNEHLPCVCVNGDKAGTLDASYYKGCGERQGVERDVVCYGVNCRAFSATEEKYPTLQSKPNGGHSLNYSGAVCYPTEPIGALCNCDFKGTSSNQHVNQGKVIVEAHSIENHPNDSRVKLDEDGKVQALTQRMGTGGGNVPLIMEEPQYIVRRLTPTECARLQGFPDWWCSDLESDGEDIEFWEEVFKTYADAMGKKPKSRSQIEKWLKNPHSDSAEYKMWGNGVALPCVYFLMRRIYEQVNHSG